MRAVAVLALVFVLTTFLISGAYLLTHTDKDVPDPKFLASDLFFQIGDFVISIPAVALIDVGVPPKNTNPLPKYRSDPKLWGEPRWFATAEFKTALLDFAGNPKTSIAITSIGLSLSVYGNYGEYAVSQQICQMLTKEWSKKACKNELRTELKGLPTGFSIAKKSALASSRFRPLTGMPAIKLNTRHAMSETDSTKAKMKCDQDLKNCKTTIEISRDVFIIWSSSCWNMKEMDCIRKALATGDILSGFVRSHLMVK